MAVDYEQQALELLRKLACWFGAGDNYSFQPQEHDVQLIAAALGAAVAEERERCAKIADEVAVALKGKTKTTASAGASTVALEIRAAEVVRLK